MLGVLTVGGAVLADASGFDHMDGFGWGLMGMAWIVVLAVVGLIIWSVLQATTRQSSRTSDDSNASAQRILAERFARGEIDDEDYRRRSDELRR